MAKRKGKIVIKKYKGGGDLIIKKYRVVSWDATQQLITITDGEGKIWELTPEDCENFMQVFKMFFGNLTFKRR